MTDCSWQFVHVLYAKQATEESGLVATSRCLNCEAVFDGELNRSKFVFSVVRAEISYLTFLYHLNCLCESVLKSFTKKLQQE